jgi:Helix-turn-helix domain
MDIHSDPEAFMEMKERALLPHNLKYLRADAPPPASKPKRPPIAERDYLTPAELADLLQVHLQTLQRQRTTGTGPDFLMVGTAIRYPKEWVEEWQAKSRRTITAPSNRGRKNSPKGLGRESPEAHMAGPANS